MRIPNNVHTRALGYFLLFMCAVAGFLGLIFLMSSYPLVVGLLLVGAVGLGISYGVASAP